MKGIMNREDVIRLSKGQKDEREEGLQIKALKLAGNVSTLYAAILTLVCVFDGFILENQRGYDFLSVAAMIMGICMLNFAVRAGYEYFKIDQKNKILFEVIVMGLFAFVCIAKTVLFFLV